MNTIFRVQILLFFLYLLSASIAQADYLAVDDRENSYDLTDHIDYFIDESNQFNVNDIQSLPEESWSRDEYTQYGFIKDTVWMRLKIDFSETTQTWFINEKISTYDKFIFYNPISDPRIYEQKEYGLFTNKPHLFNSRSILINPTHFYNKQTYYIAVKTGTPQLFVFSLINKQALNEQTFVESLALGIFYGAAFICIMFHLFIYFSVSKKESIYLYYCFYVLSFTWLALYLQGLRARFFGPPFTINDLGFSFSSPATSFSLALFLATFSFYAFTYHQLRIKLYPRLKLYFKLSMLLLCAVYTPLFFVRDSFFMGMFGAMKILFSCSLIFIGFYLYSKERYQPALYYTLAISFTVIGIAVYYLTIHGLVKGTHFTSYSATYFAIPEYILLAFSLSTRINEMSKEHQRNLDQKLYELTEATNTANKANQRKDEFLATCSHELKTPLNAIYSYLQVMKDTPLDGMQEVCVDGGVDQVEQLTRMVNELLDYSRIETGNMSYDITSANPAELIVSTVNGITAKRIKRSVEINSQILDKDNVANLTVDIDATRLKQLAANLITNAIKFTDHGFVYINLYCNRWSKTHLRYILEVKDTGIGISKDQLDEIFNKFHQINQGPSRRNEGIGLGLAIVKSIAELFNGDLDVQSNPGAGSTFTFTFTAPLSKKSFKDIDLGSNALTPQPTPNKKILLVEDNLTNRSVFKYMVDSLGIQLDLASNVDEAIDLVNTNSYAGVFLDLHMPVKDGFYFAGHVRNNIGNTRLALIAVSADSRVSTKEKCKSFGIDDFIEKPIKRHILLAKIKEVTSQNHVEKCAIGEPDAPAKKATLRIVKPEGK